MLALGLFLIFGYGIIGVPAPHGHVSILCHTCHGVSDPSHCKSLTKCAGGDVCYTEVRHENGRNLFWKGCADRHKCDEHNAPILGKRERHHATVCYECCDSTGCNTDNQCSRYAPTTTKATTTTSKAALTTTVPLPACRDHEEDGVTCASIDHDVFCSSDLSFIVDIRVQKCPAYCGMCDSNGNFLPSSTAAGLTATTVAITPKPDTAAPVVTTAGSIVSDMPTDGPTDMPTNMTTDGPTNMPTDMPTDGPTTALPCVDDESGGFSCAAFDTLNFCTDTSSVAYPLAIEKCPAHCGFCSTSGGD